MINIKTVHWHIDNIDTVLFDKDGTIQNLDIYWGEIIKMRSKALVEDLKLDAMYYKKICSWMGYDLGHRRLLERGPVGILSRDEIITQLATNFRMNNIRISCRELSALFVKVHENFLNRMDKYVKILPGVKKLIKTLNEKSIKIAIVTLDSVINTKKCMQILKLDQYIDHYVGREQSGLPKTSGEHVKIALNLLDSKSRNTVCFGDAPMDLIMAKKGGLKAGIGVAMGQTPIRELKKYSPYVLTSYKELSIY